MVGLLFNLGIKKEESFIENIVLRKSLFGNNSELLIVEYNINLKIKEVLND